jgi:hypothetical protein
MRGMHRPGAPARDLLCTPHAALGLPCVPVRRRTKLFDGLLLNHSLTISCHLSDVQTKEVAP